MFLKSDSTLDSHKRRNPILDCSAIAGLISFVILAAAGVGIATPQKTQVVSPSKTESTSISTDKSEIIETINKIGIMADTRDWGAVRSAFVDRVVFDYTSIFGGQPNEIAADTQMQQWDVFFKSTFKTTQHLIGSHVVTINGDRAVSRSHFQAYHTYLNSQKKDWILAGTYTHELIRTNNGWRVSKMVATKLWEIGDRPM